MKKFTLLLIIFTLSFNITVSAEKVKRINKPYARKIQILTVLEQRAKVSGKREQAALAKRAKEQLKRKHENDKRKV